MQERYRQAQQALDTAVRPELWAHGGDAAIVDIAADGTLLLRLQGQCAGCPGAALVTQPEIEQALRALLPWLRAVELAASVSDELLEAARQMLRRP